MVRTFQPPGQNIEPVRFLPAALAAAGKVRGVARNTGRTQFKDRLHLGLRHGPGAEYMKAVQKQGQQFWVRQVLLGQDLRRLGKIAAHG